MRTTQPVKTLQVWPSGTSYTYRGEADGPANRRSLKGYQQHGTPPGPFQTTSRWRKGTAEEWRLIAIEEYAQRYQKNYILRNQCALVESLIAINLDGFTSEDIRNIYTDTRDYDTDQCREYLADHGIPIAGKCTCEILGATIDMSTCLFHGDTEEVRSELVEACWEHAESNPAEVYEWYLVDAWLCARLHEIGEVTIDNEYGEWWGRQATGQALIMDGVLQRIAANYVTPAMYAATQRQA